MTGQVALGLDVVDRVVWRAGIDPVTGQVALGLDVVARGVGRGVRVGGTHLPDPKKE